MFVPLPKNRTPLALPAWGVFSLRHPQLTLARAAGRRARELHILVTKCLYIGSRGRCASAARTKRRSGSGDSADLCLGRTRPMQSKRSMPQASRGWSADRIRESDVVPHSRLAYPSQSCISRKSGLWEGANGATKQEESCAGSTRTKVMRAFRDFHYCRCSGSDGAANVRSHRSRPLGYHVDCEPLVGAQEPHMCARSRCGAIGCYFELAVDCERMTGKTSVTMW